MQGSQVYHFLHSLIPMYYTNNSFLAAQLIRDGLAIHIGSIFSVGKDDDTRLVSFAIRPEFFYVPYDGIHLRTPFVVSPSTVHVYPLKSLLDTGMCRSDSANAHEVVLLVQKIRHKSLHTERERRRTQDALPVVIPREGTGDSCQHFVEPHV